MSKVARKRTRDEMNNGQDAQTTKQNDQEKVIAVGEYYMVEKRNHDRPPEKMLASIIQTKLDFENDEPLEGTSRDNNEEQKRIQMFYVHYELLDRRMDEWVTRDQIFEKIDPQNRIAMLMPEIAADAGGTKYRGRTLTRSLRKIHEEFHHLKRDYDRMDATTAKLERAHEERTKVKNIPRVTIGKHCIKSWYYAPFPVHCNNHELFMCEYCLLYTPDRDIFVQHFSKCHERQPPGNEIYRKDNLSVYEIDGSSEKLYCQCLCLLSKLFMDHKTLYFDVDDFMFYVLCEVDEEGAHIVGYYSREVESANNLACIMVFPPFQNKGYGKLLIQLSYEISVREGYVGTPEKPLSDLGKVSYRSYWWWILINVLINVTVNSLSASELSAVSGIAVDDVVSTLTTAKMVRQFKESEYVIRTSRRVVEHCRHYAYGKCPRILLDKSALRWRPIMRRNEATEFSERKSSTLTSLREETEDEMSYASGSPNMSDTSMNDDNSG